MTFWHHPGIILAACVVEAGDWTELWDLQLDGITLSCITHFAKKNLTCLSPEQDRCIFTCTYMHILWICVSIIPLSSQLFTCAMCHNRSSRCHPSVLTWRFSRSLTSLRIWYMYVHLYVYVYTHDYTWIRSKACFSDEPMHCPSAQHHPSIIPCHVSIDWECLHHPSIILARGLAWAQIFENTIFCEKSRCQRYHPSGKVLTGMIILNHHEHACTKPFKII